MQHDESFWTGKYKSGSTGWDIGEVSTPLKDYIDQLGDKQIRILVPGGGNSYEAEYLHQKGFTNVFIVDISAVPLQNFADRVPDFPKEHLLHTNFFKLDRTFDLILEQTFFCALNPEFREDYVLKMRDLLNPEGKLVGVFFNIPLYSNRPPYGGSKAEYQQLFSKKFNIQKMETAYNSIPPRSGNELFFIMTN